MSERNYEFRKRLNVVHIPDRRDMSVKPSRADACLTNDWIIAVPHDTSPYLLRVAQDLQDYLLTSMGISAAVRKEHLKNVLGRTAPNAIVLGTGVNFPALGEGLSVPRSFRMIVKPDLIMVCGADERGTAQGCYYIEDVMNLAEAPILPMGDTTRSPIFQPRMVHSGWGIDQFPDVHLNAIAHAGMDAILVFVKDVNRSTTGFLDMNDLIFRASNFGLDVYFYSYLHSSKHPDELDAEAYYEGTYGRLMRECPGAKGIVFVGESCEFPSKDERTKGRTRHCPVPQGSENDPRPFPGWWPCRDYPQWLDLIKRVIRRQNPNADIVFWTYNWGWAPAEDRVALIEVLPVDISLQATFEMFETIPKQGIKTRCVDYTASFEGPGNYFRTEAEAAHRRGIPLYTMANTAGLSWDIGIIPYEPIPFQWNRRYEALRKAHEKWGLQGLMESHHYGWWPSVVSELAKWSYWNPVPDFDVLTKRLADRDFGAKGGCLALQAWQSWSNAIRSYVPTNEDQYGPFRIGPAYPLVFLDRDVEIPAADYAHFGNRIVKTLYRSHAPNDVPTEIELLEQMTAQWQDGVKAITQAVAAAPASKRPNAYRMQVLGEFIQCCIQTTIHVKKWYLLNRCVQENTDLLGRKNALDGMIALARQEIRNANAAIPLVEADSRLGWEPSMEYMCDRSHIEWKIAHLQRVIDEEIPTYRRAL